MKNKNFTAGIILSVLGILLLLKNFDLMNLDWDTIFKFWPLLLIYAGLASIYSNKKTWLIPLAMGVITIIAIILWLGFKDSGILTFNSSLFFKHL